MNLQTIAISATTLAILVADPALGQVVTTEPVETRDGFDWGWIGLLGLIGLAGLAGRRRNDTHRTTTTPR